MGHRTAVVDRVVVGFVGLASVVGSLLLLAWHRRWPFAVDIADRVDLGWFADAPQQRYWTAAMFMVAVVCLVGGLALLFANLARHRLGPAVLAGSDEAGALAIDLGALASAIAEDLEDAVPGVVAASASAVLERGQPTIPVTLVVDPRTDLHQLVRVAEATAHEVAHALDGADVAIRVLVTCARVHN